MLTNPPRYVISEDDDIPSINCNYFSLSDAKDKLMDYGKQSFSLLTCNIRSCRKNMPSLTSFLSLLMFKFSLIILVETWLTKDIDHALNIDGYKQINLYRSSHGGGIKILYDSSFQVETVQDLTFVNNLIEIITFYVFDGFFKYLICAIYRPPSASIRDFNDLLFNNILDKFPNNIKVIITGDFNINLYNPYKTKTISDFISGCLGFNFYPVINLPSIFHENNITTKFSLIDQIWCNDGSGTHHQSGIIEYPISDHLPMFYVFRNFSKSHFNKKLRVFSVANKNRFINSFNNLNFDFVYNSDDVNLAFNHFYEKCLNCMTSVFQ